VKDVASYATHPVVHRWAYYFPGEDVRVELAQLAIIMVGWAVPDSSTRDYSTMQRRLLPHAQVCSQWVLAVETGLRTRSYTSGNTDLVESEEKEATLDAIHNLGNLYADQGKLIEAEKMYERALGDYEEALGLEH
ncbi:hypothetical protein MMC14_003258, partial [Varicellaria rhodocarpa]|nr:hypothetical protein [Varicellaria rhodocarpa]